MNEPLRILLVDDQPLTETMLRRMFSNLDSEQLELHYVRDSLQAEAEVRKINPDVVLLDLNMPDLDGMELLARFRQNAETSRIPVIMLSADDEAEQKAKSFAFGANDYVVKLPESIEMLARIRFHGNSYRTLLKNEQSERKEREQLRLMQCMMETVHDAIITMDSDGRITDFNASASALFGYSAKEVISRDLTELIIPPDLQERQKTVFLRYLIAETSTPRRLKQIEVEGVHLDGHKIDIELSITAIKKQGEDLFFCFIKDISFRKQAEKDQQINIQSKTAINKLLNTALEDVPLENILKTALELTLSGSWLATKNKGAIFLLDNSSETLVMTVQQGIEKDVQAECHNLPLGTCLCGQAGKSCKIIFASNIDDRHNIRTEGMQPHGHYCVPILFHDNLLGVMVVYLLDGHVQDPIEEDFLTAMANTMAGIIEKKKMEKELRVAKIAADSANRSKSMFLATMSHEIRTPMNAIIGMADMVGEMSSEDERQEAMDIIKESGFALLTIINDILDLAKIESGELHIQKELFSPRDLLSSVFGIMRIPAIKEKGLKLIKEINPNTPNGVESDHSRLRQILINLVGNAVKFTENGSVKIAIKAETDSAENHNLVFSVADTGIGINKEELDLIFGSFVQAKSTSNRKYGGTGLGLSICKRLTMAMGGKIWAESVVGSGSTFYVAVPVTVVNLEIPASGPLKNHNNDVRVLEKPPSFYLSKAASLIQKISPDTRILIAEDDTVNQLVILKMFKRLGFIPDLAQNGLEVLEFTKIKDYDLIFMDMQMPVMCGIEAVELLREQEKNSKHDHRATVIALTANALEEDKNICISSGMDGFLSKPITGRDLENALHNWANKKSSESSFSPKKDIPTTYGSINVETLKEFISDIGDDYVSLIPIMLKGMSEGIEKIAFAIESEEADDLQNIAHKMKSSCRQLGFDHAGICAEQLEMIGRKGTTKDAKEYLKELELEVLVMEKAIYNILKA